MNVAVTNTAKPDELAAALTKFWNTESFFKNSDKPLLSPDEQFVIEHFNSSVQYDGKQYTVALPFNPDKGRPQNNYYSALSQFKSLERALLRSPAKREKYVEAMNKYINDGFAEVNADEFPERSAGYFLPHHAIYRELHASTKVRIVFNGSSPDVAGTSLNDVLLTGPKLQPDLCQILIQFRAFPVALTGDIKSMFSMIKVAESDRQ